MGLKGFDVSEAKSDLMQSGDSRKQVTGNDYDFEDEVMLQAA